MRLLKYDDDGNYTLTDNLVRQAAIPPYAILSHTWGSDGDEITYKDILNLDDSVRNKRGFKKLQFCAKQAKNEGLEHFWVDTCCIDKSDSTELNEAINSMFSWYAKSEVCYVYLSDVNTEEDDCRLHDPVHEPNKGMDPDLTMESRVRASRWFTRGWTLQELIAPRKVMFFSSSGAFLFQKTTDQKSPRHGFASTASPDERWQEVLHEITEIPLSVLRGGMPLFCFGIEERLRWVASRQTTREEDMAYCLLGIFDVFIPLIYGEGKDNASYRLRRAIEEKEYQQAMAGFPPESSGDSKPNVAGTSMLLSGLIGGVGGSIAALGLMGSAAQLGKTGPSSDTFDWRSSAPSPSSRSLPFSSLHGRAPQPSTPKEQVGPEARGVAAQEFSLPIKTEGPKDNTSCLSEAKPGSSHGSSQSSVCAVEVKLNSHGFRLPEWLLLRSLRKLFPDVPKEDFKLTRRDRYYQVWLPRDLTEACYKVKYTHIQKLILKQSSGRAGESDNSKFT